MRPSRQEAQERKMIKLNGRRTTVSLCKFFISFALFVLCAPGAQAQHLQTFDIDSGPALPWEGSFGDIATFTGNKNTEITLVSWTCRGGMPFEFSLYHNNKGSHCSELGWKWTHSFDIYAYVDPGSGGV